MGRKFMIVKPTECCGYSEGIGLIYSLGSHIVHPLTECIICGKISLSLNEIPYIDQSGDELVISESRIAWLPDEQDLLDHDEQLEVVV